MPQTSINTGSRPSAETSEAAAAEHVREIFNSIAPSYDRLNHLLSMGLDRRWWSRSARTFRSILAQPDARVLDLCCGTGDMTEALLKLRPGAPHLASEMWVSTESNTPTPITPATKPGAPHLAPEMWASTKSNTPTPTPITPKTKPGAPHLASEMWASAEPNTLTPTPINPTTKPGAPHLASEMWVSTESNTPTPTPISPATKPGAPHLASEMWASTKSNTPTPIIGLDFSAAMLARARQKFPTPQIHWVEADAMHLPYPDNSFDLVTSAFGFRNLRNYAEALAEIRRVLRPSGQLGILECNQPSGLRGFGYNVYLHHVLPFVGGLISGDRAAYRYLPASIARFPRSPQMLQMLSEAGFTTPTWTGFLFHAAGLYTATKP